ncbi:rhomboid family intramembrane serine protease [Kamptonema formosum]|uniref:rhomboid family intramembrane serine protease n=1 Tax=Kamptonema formosum TaxID=331992 RepID=UPI00034CC252|nr:rhomboid family intramembrane serine protease [Oscillatoria sp. PCC 10802]
MIPIADNIITRNRFNVNYLLIGLTVALFLWELKLEAAGKLTDFLLLWGIVPQQLSAVAAEAIGQKNPAAWFVLLFMSARSLLGAMFLHGSFSQILGNLLFLWVFGKSVADILGSGRFLLLYLLCGALTGTAQILLDPAVAVPVVGANGAVAGILGAYLLSFPKAKIDSILPLVILYIPVQLPALFYLPWWFAQQAFYGIGQLEVAGGVNSGGMVFWAQIVGLAVGAALVPVMAKRKPNTAIY